MSSAPGLGQNWKVGFFDGFYRGKNVSKVMGFLVENVASQMTCFTNVFWGLAVSRARGVQI